MNGYLRQSTASQSRLIGPFVSDTDFKTAQTGLTIANTDIKLRANGTTLSNKNSGGGTHQVNGMYSLTWDATDTANVGELFFVVSVSGSMLVWGVYIVLEEAVYDALFAASALGYVADQPVNATKIGGTTQTGRDIGASVLLSSGTGAGQLDFTSGVVKANLAQILGTALTETAGQIAAAFKKFFDKASPTGTINSLPDAVPDAAGGLPVTGTRLTAIPTLPAALVGGRIDASVGAMAASVITATAINDDAINNAKVANDVVVASVLGSVGSVATGVTVSTNNDKAGYGLSSAAVQAIWDALTSALTTTGSIGKWIVDKLDVVLSTRLASASYTAPLDAAGVRSAVGLGSANLDTQLSTIDDFLDTEIGAIKAKTDNLPSDPADASDIAAGFLTVDAIKAKTDNLPASPAATGDIPTVVEIAAAMFLQDSGQVYADAVGGSVVKEIADNAGGVSAADIADAVLDDDLVDHVTEGSISQIVKGVLTTVQNQRITGLRTGSTNFFFPGGTIPSSAQGNFIVALTGLDVEFDNQYQHLLFAMAPDSFIAFDADVVSSDASDNTLTLSRPIPDFGWSDPIPFILLPAGLGDATKALILYEGS